ncbi:beta-1,4-glucuronyltransferase 1-like isoform X2 [Anneissia japonica]|uniref:beta-1,4-glucuronyltransferase 1-like isoform X2 n=1 Tax=Anneissia japonica TaxID=1529436 RepID=UPI0014255F3C|nr:beta-1,4-glucuronyltransferase 1-like isoform X2 [Anneissia japonica]
MSMVIHLIMLSWLDERTTKRQAQNWSDKLHQSLLAKEEKRQSEAKLDSSGQYKVHKNYAISHQQDSLNTENDVTIVTQCSVNHLHHLAQLTEEWDGLISVSVFTTKLQVHIADAAIFTLRECFEKIRTNVAFHIVYPFTFQDINEIQNKRHDIELLDLSCENVLHTITNLNLFMQNYDLSGIPYPNNLLRNVARTGVQSTYIFVIDIDMLPNKHLRTDFLSFLQNSVISEELSDVVYVVPAFELPDNSPRPTTKQELLKQYDNNGVRPFYIELCKKCQFPTDYESWRNLESKHGLGVAYSREWVDPWEPFYISRSDVPFYDEQFKQYGFNRISQVCELHVAGFKFSVLDNAFILHLGYKTKTGFHSSKDEENLKNKFLFRRFKEALLTKYPESSRRC